MALEAREINPLNAELNPIRHLLPLVGARHIVPVSRPMVKRETDQQGTVPRCPIGSRRLGIDSGRSHTIICQYPFVKQGCTTVSFDIEDGIL